MNTTHTNEPIEKAVKHKRTLSMADLEMRDYFAAKAMAGLIQRYDHGDDFWWVDLSVEDDAGLIRQELEKDAMRCYRVADAMLKARDQ